MSDIAAQIFLRPMPSITAPQQTLPEESAGQTLARWWCQANTAIAQHPLLAVAGLVGLFAFAKPLSGQVRKLTGTKTRRTR